MADMKVVAHRGSNHIAPSEFISGRLLYEPHRFDAENARKVDARRMSLPRKQLRAV
jgi:hypothetical protein